MYRANSNAKTTTDSSSRGALATPILKYSQRHVAQLSRRQSTSISHLRRLAIRDPSVAINLFANANALLICGGRAPVTDIGRAISFIGVDDFFSIIANADVLEDDYQSAAYKSKIRILSRAHHASHQACSIARLVGGVNCDQVLAAALTQEALEYVASGDNIDATNITELKSLLPSPLRDPDVSPIFRTCVDLGVRFARATEVSWDEKILAPIVDELGQLCRRKPGEIARRLLNTSLETARASDHFGGFSPIVHLIAAGILPSNANASISKKTPIRPEVIATSTEVPLPQSSSKSIAEKGPVVDNSIPSSKPQFESVINKFTASNHGKGDVAALLTALLDITRRQLHMRLAILLTFDRSTGTLRVGLHNGLMLPEDVRNANLDPKKSKLLPRLLGAPHMIHWQPPGNQDDLGGLMLKFVGNEPAVLHSLYSYGKPFAIILACRPQRESRLTSAKLKSFRQLCGTVMTALDARPPKVARPAA